MASTISAGTSTGTALNLVGDTSGALALQTNNGTTALTIDTSQNVGIGTASPNQKLRVENNANSSTWNNIANSSAGNGAGSGILFTTDQGDAGALFQNSSGNAGGSGANSLRIRNLLNAPIGFEINGTERARIDTTGNLLIGTTTTTVNRITAVSPSNQAVIGLYNTATAPAAGFAAIRLGDASGSDKWQVQYNNSDGTLNFYDFTAAVTRVSVSSAGVLSFNSGYGSTAAAYGCRAWVNFNGVGTIAIRASGNVSSITDLATGQYQANYTVAFPDTSYCAVVSSWDDGISPLACANRRVRAQAVGNSLIYLTNPSGTYADSDQIFLSVFR